MTQRLILPLMLVLAAITGCASKSSHSATGSDTLSGLELPVPDIPDSITHPERRAAYAALRWWDALDFANDSRSLDTAFIEQNFVNFMTVLANTDTLSRQRAVDRLLSSAQHSPQAWSLMTEVAEKYLYDPNSPFRSDELYIPFLRTQSRSPLADEARRARDAYRLAMAMKNRPGHPATDFSFVTRDGLRTSLHAVKSDKPLLLIFYNPDCESCGKTIARLRKVNHTSPYTVLAIDAESERDRWEATAADMPADWTVGYALTPVLEEELYDLKASPTIYVLDTDKRVIGKDVAPELLTDD